MKKIIIIGLIITLTINTTESQKTNDSYPMSPSDTKAAPTQQAISSTDQWRSFCKKYGVTLLAGGSIGAITGTILNIKCTEYIYTKHKSDKYSQHPALFFTQLFTKIIAMNIAESLARISATYLIQIDLDERKMEHDKMAMQLIASAASWAAFLMIKKTTILNKK